MLSIQYHRETSRQRLSIYNIYTTICQKTLDIGGQRYFSRYIDQLWSGTGDFPLRKKNMGLKHWILPNNQFKTHLFFFNFWVGGTLFSLDLGPKGDSNFKPLWRSRLTSVRGPISYRIFFMAYYFSFLLSLDLLLTLKFTSNSLPTTQTFLHERKVLGVSNLVCKLKGSHHLKKWIIQTFSNFRHF